jgi:hypothetical protein
MVQIQKVAVTQRGLVPLFQIHASHYLCIPLHGCRGGGRHWNKSGNDRKTCAFEKEFDIMFVGNPSIKPAASSSSCIFPVQEKCKELDDDCTEAVEN